MKSYREMARRLVKLEAQEQVHDDMVEIVLRYQRPDGTIYETWRSRVPRAQVEGDPARARAKVQAYVERFADAPPLTEADIDQRSIMELIARGYVNAAIARLEHYRQSQDVPIEDVELEEKLRAIVANAQERKP